MKLPVALYIANTFSYRFLDTNDSLAATSTDLQDYYISFNSTTIGQFNQIEKSINSGDFTAATSILSSLDQSLFNQVEANYYTFYVLYKKYMIGSDPLSSDDIMALSDLAALCPGTNGDPVYQARALYKLATGSVYNGADGCVEYGARPGSGSEKQNIHSAKLLKTWNVDLFPNPTSDVVTIISKNEIESLTIMIKDLTGRVVFKKNLITSSYFSSIELHLIDGAYFVTINNNNDFITKKLIIAK